MTTPSPDEKPSEEPKVLTWGFRAVLLSSALYIAGCSAYFSVLGLGQLFTGSEGPVMVMAASLEVGKLVAASFLYRYWDRINGAMRFYLTVAVLVLIAITSLGNYGFLARAYEKTHTQIVINEGQIANLEKEIAEINKQVEDARVKNSRVNTASREDLANFHSRYEEPLRVRWRDFEVFTCGPWCQGPMLAQARERLLDGLAQLGLVRHEYLEQLVGGRVATLRRRRGAKIWRARRLRRRKVRTAA